MKTTLNIDDTLFKKASRLTGISQKTQLVQKGLETLIALESMRHLAALGGSDPTATAGRRRRSK